MRAIQAGQIGSRTCSVNSFPRTGVDSSLRLAALGRPRANEAMRPPGGGTPFARDTVRALVRALPAGRAAAGGPDGAESFVGLPRRSAAALSRGPRVGVAGRVPEQSGTVGKRDGAVAAAGARRGGSEPSDEWLWGFDRPDGPLPERRQRGTSRARCLARKGGKPGNARETNKHCGGHARDPTWDPTPEYGRAREGQSPAPPRSAQPAAALSLPPAGARGRLALRPCPLGPGARPRQSGAS